ncbi:hypothetical protein B0O99DRAFT_695173 [Bisporella sp. PMI_857]|nr:hypothetical protein B0O99DRAFT_695173 [Bisporella sp. PMI_857]
MVLGIITSIAACPAIIGTTEAVRQGQNQNAKNKHRGRKANLLVTCSDPSSKARDIHGGTVVLRDGKFYVTTVNPKARYAKSSEHPKKEDRVAERGHLFAGYFFPYPESTWGRKGEGYVTTISDDPPQLNWVYIDKDTYQMKYGLKKDTIDQFVGPWNVTPIDRRLSFDGWEGFTVVEEEPNVWALYFDMEDNGLKGKVDPKRRIMEVELTRKEIRIEKSDAYNL